MNPNLMILLLVGTDLILLGVIFYLLKRVSLPPASIYDLTGEREMLNQMQASVRAELRASVEKCESLHKQVSHLAMEVEQEVKQGNGQLAKELEALSANMLEHFKKPLGELSEKASRLEALISKAEKQRSILGTLVGRAEKICAFFNEKVPYQEILTEIEEKKYSDARRLMGMGVPPEKVASDLSLSLGQVKLLKSL